MFNQKEFLGAYPECCRSSEIIRTTAWCFAFGDILFHSKKRYAFKRQLV